MKRIPNDEYYPDNKGFLINAKGNEMERENGEKNYDAHWWWYLISNAFMRKKKKFFLPIFFFFFGKVNRTRHKVKKEKKSALNETSASEELANYLYFFLS